MFEPSFIIDAVVLFAIGLWPLLLVVTAAGVRWFNARRRLPAMPDHLPCLRCFAQWRCYACRLLLQSHPS